MAQPETPMLSRGLLRFATAGAVDAGKSTLIGRLLHDSKSLLTDQLEAVERASRDRDDVGPDLALLTDGLRAEREQGITIDVAHRYFETAARAFILADTPGHAEYTRNMVTGASNSDLAVVLVDARHGLTEQSRRHAVVAGLLRVPHLVLAVNKMDLVGYDQDAFARIARAFDDFASGLTVDAVTKIPVSALHGDNVVNRSGAMPWYQGPTLLEHLERVPVASAWAGGGLRYPVQSVLHSTSGANLYAGQVTGGRLVAGGELLHLPSGRTTRVASIDTKDGSLPEAGPPLSVSVRTNDPIGISRGDMLCDPDDAPTTTWSFDAMVCWLTAEPVLREGSRLMFKHTTRTTHAVVTRLNHRLDVTTKAREGAPELRLNDIGSVRVELAEPVFCDAYARNRHTGGGILVDEVTHATAGAVVITRTS